MDLLLSPLFKQQSYIAGQWVSNQSKESITVFNPADNSLIGTIPNLNPQEIEQAIMYAHQAFSSWRSVKPKERAAILNQWYQLMLKHIDELAYILSLEQGKPLSEATNEIHYAANFIAWFAEEAKRIYGDIIPTSTAHKKAFALKEPIGVVACITPWNFPSAMVTRKCAPALAAGCTVILKPAENTPFSALALAQLAEEAGLPPGVLNIVTGEAKKIGAVFTSHPLVRKLSFTGSTATGKLLMAQCAATIKKISLELGGNAPFITFDDASLEETLEYAIAAKFRNAGQTCVAVNRFLVQDSIYETFQEKIIEKIKTLKIGSGMQIDSDIGPLINEKAIQKIENYLIDACEKGAKILWGGKRLTNLGPNFFEPTVIGYVKPHMRIAQEEIFGPIVSLMPFKTEEEALHIANDTEYGLAAYACTQNLNRIWRLAEQLEYGMIGINTGNFSNEMAPFGGVKQSGIGREGSKYGLQEFLEIKYVCLG